MARSSRKGIVGNRSERLKMSHATKEEVERNLQQSHGPTRPVELMYMYKDSINKYHFFEYKVSVSGCSILIFCFCVKIGTHVVTHGLCGLTAIAVRSDEFPRFRGLRPGNAVAEAGSHADVVVYGGGLVARRGHYLLDGRRLTPGVPVRIQNYVVHLWTDRGVNAAEFSSGKRLSVAYDRVSCKLSATERTRRCSFRWKWSF